MDHQLLTFAWDVPGPTLLLSLPRDVPQVGWVPVNAEAKNAGSAGSLESPSTLGVFFPSLSDSVEDVLYGRSLFDDGFCSQESLTNVADATDFDLSFLPSSPESLDYVDVAVVDPGPLAHGIKDIPVRVTDGHNEIVRESLTPENVKVEQAVGDPDVALSLIKQLSADHTVFETEIRRSLSEEYAPIIIQPFGRTPFIQNQTQAASTTAFQLMSVAPTDSTSFHVDSFFVDCTDSKMTETTALNNNLDSQGSPPSALTLRDLISVPSVRQAFLPVSPAGSDSSSSSSASVDSISFEDIVVPQQTGSSLVIRPEKRQRKKEQNKNAALKYRQKKRTEQGNFVSECLETEKRNAELKLRVNEITREINYLKGLLLEISVA